MMAKPIRALELHYPMIQFLINDVIYYLFVSAILMSHLRLGSGTQSNIASYVEI